MGFVVSTTLTVLWTWVIFPSESETEYWIKYVATVLVSTLPSIEIWDGVSDVSPKLPSSGSNAKAPGSEYVSPT